MEWINALFERATQWWLYITTGQTLAAVLGVLFAVLAVGLFVASKTKWGKAKPLTKFVVVSVVLHVWLLLYAVGDKLILPQGDLKGADSGKREHAITVTFDDDSAAPNDQLADSSLPAEEAGPSWQQSLDWDQVEQPEALQGVDLDDLQAGNAPLPTIELTPMASLPPLPEEPLLVDESAEAIPQVESFVTQPIVEDLTPRKDRASNTAEAAIAASSPSPPVADLPQRLLQSAVPNAFELRQASDRLQRARAFGADADTEAAVEAALGWLAKVQTTQGGWDAAAHGAGTETRALNEYRYGTGRNADTGVTGLALLAFLSAGHTHQNGPYSENVRRGLDYLIQVQLPSGDLSGPKQLGSDPTSLYARMYCHSIATLAMAEAFAMTGDRRLEKPLLSAAQYSINAQDVRGGGWRYRPRDPGDLSQFGWQAMALKSVEYSGIAVPGDVKNRMRRFADSCATGRAGGLATYKPNEGRPSATMTAEALACRLLLKYPVSDAARREAIEMIMGHAPGAGQDNVYFWYYATLALFQLQDENWQSWNQLLKQRLLQTQVPRYGDQPGSWEPDSLWGGYGGRVYSTAMSCLCLEVYYRYLPMYRGNAVAERGIRGPGWR